MASETSRKWLDAAIELGEVATSKVACPECDQANLLIQDLISEGGLSERRMFCPNCGAQNYILFSRDMKREKTDTK